MGRVQLDLLQPRQGRRRLQNVVSGVRRRPMGRRRLADVLRRQQGRAALGKAKPGTRRIQGFKGEQHPAQRAEQAGVCVHRSARHA